MNIAVQNEFKQRDLGVATSSIQLFRGLGSTIGIAIFGALLTSGLVGQLEGAQTTVYLNQLKNDPMVAEQFGDVAETDTMLTLNMVDVRSSIRDMVLARIDGTTLSYDEKISQKESFIRAQDEYTDIITHAFSDSLRQIFVVAALLMATAIPLVFSMKQRILKSADSHTTPSEM